MGILLLHDLRTESLENTASDGSSIVARHGVLLPSDFLRIC
jgi:hypothetical protein